MLERRMISEIVNDDCIEYLKTTKQSFDLTFLDPPFNQNKDYKSHDDNMKPDDYWAWMRTVCDNIYDKTSPGGAIYFMQREKNIKDVMITLEETSWKFQNLIIWKKKSSAVPGKDKFGKHYQVIVFATKGQKPRVFNKLRIDPPLLVTEKYSRPNGVFVTDVWDNIRELTSGYFAGDEPLRLQNGERLHNQQSPIQLLLRIILSSSKPGDFVFDPFSGTATTSIVSMQLARNSVVVEKDELNYQYCIKRLQKFRYVDKIDRFRKEYGFTENLDEIWGSNSDKVFNLPQLTLFDRRASYRCAQ
jgi:site-specific DNA-methyltransferase (adenine-specific)